MDKFFPKQFHFGGMIAHAARQRQRLNGYAARPGTGPRGQRCNTCAHCLEVVQAAATVRKCQVTVRQWTPCHKTNIKPNAPACSEWVRKPFRRVEV